MSAVDNIELIFILIIRFSGKIYFSDNLGNNISIFLIVFGMQVFDNVLKKSHKEESIFLISLVADESQADCLIKA